MITVTVKNNVKFPRLNFQKDLEYIGENIIMADLIRGIDLQMAISGGQLKENSAKTLERKARLGHGSKSLIDTGLLRSSFYSKPKGKNRVVVSIDSIRKDIGSYCQEKGYMFFGISKDAYDGIVKYMSQRIKELTNG